MKREPLKAGDRVAVYGISGQDGWHHRLCGTVRVVQEEPPRIHFDADEILPRDGYVERYVAVPEQCRRLKRRERRRVWIRESVGGNLTSGYYTQVMGGDGGHPDGRWIEFIEVRPRKERGA